MLRIYIFDPNFFWINYLSIQKIVKFSSEQNIWLQIFLFGRKFFHKF